MKNARSNNFEHKKGFRLWGCVIWLLITEHSIKHFTIIESYSHTDTIFGSLCKLIVLIYQYGLSDMKHACNCFVLTG